MSASNVLSIQSILDLLEARAPSGTAEDWDNVGLLLGDRRSKTSGVTIAHDLSFSALQTAQKLGHRLIVTHHPSIFPKSRGLARITGDGSVNPNVPLPALLLEAAKGRIAVIACHTNFDQCALEVPLRVAEGLGAQIQGRLLDPGGQKLLKLVVFVPENHAERVRDAVCAAGAGQIGNYGVATFSAKGLGTFLPNSSARPFLGRAGRLETVAEVRLETVFPQGLQQPVLKALRQSHPYEEIAYDLFSLLQVPPRAGLTKGLGYGFIGEFTKSKSFSEVSRDAKRLFKLDGFWVSHPVPSRIRKIAFAAGKGASFVGVAASAGVDLFITGEVGYHGVLDGSRRGMAVMELGHRESERFFLSTMSDWMKAAGLKTALIRERAQRIWTAGGITK